MMDVGRHVFYCMFCFVLIYPYITYTQFYASIKKRKKKFKKKNIFDARRLRRIRDSLPWIRLSFGVEEVLASRIFVSGTFDRFRVEDQEFWNEEDGV